MKNSPKNKSIDNSKYKAIDQKVIMMNTFLEVNDKKISDENRWSLLDTWQKMVKERGRRKSLDIDFP